MLSVACVFQPHVPRHREHGPCKVRTLRCISWSRMERATIGLFLSNVAHQPRASDCVWICNFAIPCIKSPTRIPRHMSCLNKIQTKFRRTRVYWMVNSVFEWNFGFEPRHWKRVDLPLRQEPFKDRLISNEPSYWLGIPLTYINLPIYEIIKSGRSFTKLFIIPLTNSYRPLTSNNCVAVAVTWFAVYTDHHIVPDVPLHINTTASTAIFRFLIASIEPTVRRGLMVDTEK